MGIWVGGRGRVFWDLQLIFTAGVLTFYIIQKTDSEKREPTHRLTFPRTLVLEEETAS